MVKEAEKYAEEDKKRKESAEVHNQANSVVYATEKALADYGDKVSASDKEAIQKEVDELKKAIESKDNDKIKAAMDSVQKASHKLAEEVYKATASQQTGAGEAGAGGAGTGTQGQAGANEEKPKKGGDDDVIDADFKAE
jgi:molecular chaperone DnaK